MMCAGLSGCATMRYRASDADLRPCTDGFAATADGWMLGVRHFRPAVIDPNKRPVVLCHGLGLNGTFWTIADDDLPSQLVARGYQVFVFDTRGAGGSYQLGARGKVNSALRQTPLKEIGEGEWSMDDLVQYDVPAVLDYVRTVTGQEQVDWVGHSLGGMLMYAFLEVSPHRDRIATFVSMGSAPLLANPTDPKLIRATRNLRMLLRYSSTGRWARPLMLYRPPGLSRVDKYYFADHNVDTRTVSRFYGYTLEAPSRMAFKQLSSYLEDGHLLSADGKIDYAARIGEITTPTLFIVGDADLVADVPSSVITFNGLGSTDKTMLRFGAAEGHYGDYGHCDLVWSRHAPREVFPPLIDWLDRHQPGTAASPQKPTHAMPSPQGAGR
jgi:lysosomal acid lipase/cholesteryl ester hydrolase